jgi:cell division protein FtsI (penicillin-binding protein 3)
VAEETASSAWRRIIRTRAIGLAIAFAVWAAAIEARLVDLQVFQRADLQARADRQQNRTIAAAARRGEILDRHGRILAYSVDSDSIYAVPTEIDDPEKTTAALCGALDDCSPREREALVERLKRPKVFSFVRRQVSPAEARRVAGLGLAGVGFIKESRRFYPNRELAAHLLGYVGIDGNGLDGIEAAYDRQIGGRPGTILIQTDARRQAFSRIGRPPTPGTTLELTIDGGLQHIVERELRAGVVENRAAGGSAIVVDPHTGEILALANEPTFNPNAFSVAGEEARRNRAVQDLYEPGSTFKVVTASAAIEEKVWSPSDLVDVSGGMIRIGSRVVDDVHSYGVLSFTDVIVKSSNVGAIKIGLRLGADRLGRYVQRFGFGTRLSPDFPSENAGIVWKPTEWNDSALASVSMGYQVGVTPLQMATAVSTVANGGEIVQPRVVRAAIVNGRRVEVPHKVLRRAISLATAAELTTIMEQVVERGTAKAAQIPGYSVAGKTGTAAKLIDGHYSRSDYNASFVGFLPSRKPALTVLVVIDAPKAGAYFGGTVAAPIFRRIAEAAVQYLGIPPAISPAPPVLVLRRAAADLGPSSPVATVVPAVAAGSRAAVVPEFRGCGARDAIGALARLGITARVSGSGVVVAQDPAPGSLLDPGASVRLWLGRPVASGEHPGSQP